MYVLYIISFPITIVLTKKIEVIQESIYIHHNRSRFPDLQCNHLMNNSMASKP